MQLLRQWRRKRIVERSSLGEAEWRNAVAELPVLDGFSEAELERLKDLVVLFLHEKRFDIKGDLGADPQLRLTIAAQACLLILNLGFDYYRDWTTIIVYPESFGVRREVRDSAGVVHAQHDPLAGEAWPRGPVVLSWYDVLTSGDGFNVVIHEFAHKLDMLNGEVNGFPPLHADMDAAWWSRVFNLAYEDFCRQVDEGLETVFDPYAAQDPGEFFAVMSEAFFETPDLLRATYAPIYRQLSAFYRQDPAARLRSLGAVNRTAPL